MGRVIWTVHINDDVHSHVSSITTDTQGSYAHTLNIGLKAVYFSAVTTCIGILYFSLSTSCN